MMGKPEVSIVIPIYNQEACIEDTVKNIKDTIDWLESQTLEFLQKYTNADMSTYKKS